MYDLYIEDIQFPVAPNKMDTKISNQNKSINLLNDGEVNILKEPGLTDVSFDVLLPSHMYPFAVYPDGFKPPYIYLEHLKYLKMNKKSFRFIVVRSKVLNVLYDTNMLVSLEDYSIKEDSGDGLDIVVSIKLKQYRNYGTKVVTIKKDKKTTKKTAGKKSVQKKRPSKSISKTYKVRNGDTLWGICKKQLGNGSKCWEIAKKNNIKNPNLIYSGQVIRF